MQGCSAFFASLCQGQLPHPDDEPKRVESDERNLQPLGNGLNDVKSKATRLQIQHTEVQDPLAFLQLQRELGAAQGTWLTRARAAIGSVASAFDAAEVRLYGAVRAEKDGPPTSFVLLLSTSDSAHSLPLPGHEVWPEPSGEPDTTHPERLPPLLPPLTCDLASSCPRQLLLDLLPHMLDRAIASQAPVVRAAAPGSTHPTRATSPSPTQDPASGIKSASEARPPGNNNLHSTALYGSSTVTADPTITPTINNANMAALVPLLSGNRLYGVLWIARYGRIQTSLVNHDSPPPPRLPAPSPEASTAPASGSTEATPPRLRLQDSLLLQQLSLILSMCLLGSDLSYMVTLCDCLHQVSAASGMQAFLSGLCDGMVQLVRQRFLLEPRVIPALVPEPTSTVGLMISWAATDRGPNAAGVLSSTHTQTKTSRYPAPPPPQSVLSWGAPRCENVHASAGAPRTPRIVAGPVATLTGKEAVMLLSRTQSETSPRSVRRHTAAATGLDGSTPGAAGGVRSVRANSVQRVIPLVKVDLCGTNPSDIAPGTTNVGVTAAALLSATSGAAGAPVLRVKPFPMAHTLLRHVIRKAGGYWASVYTSTSIGATAAASGAAGAASTDTPPPPPPHFITRPYGMAVEDCTSHVQDAKRPSRDLLLLLSNMSTGFNGAAFQQILHDCGSAAADSGGGGGGGGGGAGSSSLAPALPARSCGSFTSGRRAVGSLLLLALPTDEDKNVLGLYVTFPQLLPVQLLIEVKTNLLDLLEVAAPLVAYMLRNELSLEFETLSAAPPGSYAVVGGPELEVNAAVTITNSRRSCDLGCITSDVRLSSTTPNILKPHDQRAAQQPAAERIVTMYGRLAPYAFCDPRSPSRHGSCTLAMGVGGGAGDMNSINLMDTLTGAGAEGGGGMGGSPSDRYDDGGAHSINHGLLNTGPDVYNANVIHVEEIDTVNSSMRAQMPLLVASMQSSISSMRVEATVAAMTAAASSLRTNATLTGGSRTSLLPTGAPDMGDLAQLELHHQLGHGGCAVVFKGTLGIWDCAVKLMEMPEVDDVAALRCRASIKTGVNGGAEGGAPPSPEGAGAGPAGAAGGGRGGGGDNGGGAAGGGGTDGVGGDDDEFGLQHVSARKMLLRNAMELAAMTTISHPNIMQVYNTFSNVVLSRRTMPDNSERLFLKPVDRCNNNPGIHAVCVAIVCEWCDKSCLSTALCKRTFPVYIAATAASSSGSSSSRRAGGVNSANSSRTTTARFGARMLDYRGIYMTLLDVAMALRHLHSHRLIHRDLKAANVLLKTNYMDPRGFTAKLADFGFVTMLNQQGDEVNGGEPFAVVDDICGTVTHMPPECWSKPTQLDAGHDVFSFGILMWELTAGGVRPYPDVDPKNIPRMVRRGVRPTFDEAAPPFYRMLAQRCWAADPSHRPRTSRIVSLISQQLGRM